MATLQQIDQLAADLEAARERMATAIAASPDLFLDHKTIVMHGVKVGLKPEPLEVLWANDAAVVAAIRQHVPELFAELVTVTETPIEGQLARLDSARLALLGVKVKPAGSRVIVRFGDGNDRQMSLGLAAGAAPC